MNFYRVGKVIGITAGQGNTFDLREHTHKAVLFQTGTGLGGAMQITMYDASTSTPVGITLTVPAVATPAPYIFPGVIRSIIPGTSQRIILLG
jgi:hypothetical protein